MKKILLALMLILGGISFSNAQCTPGPEYGNGIYPDTTTNLIFGCKDVPYEQVISIKVPMDTVIDTNLMGQNLTINAVFDYIEVLDVEGLPNGLSFACNPNDCKFPGNDVGCAVISGTTSEVGTHELLFKLEAHLNAQVPLVGNLPLDQPYDLDSYRIIILDSESPECEGLGIETLTESATVKVFPNPATDIVTISNLPKYGVKNIHIYNVEGKVIHTYFTESESLSIHTSTFKAGAYFIKVMKNNGSETIKLIIE